MERKVGEIFEYNGEWYQCIVVVIRFQICIFDILNTASAYLLIKTS